MGEGQVLESGTHRQLLADENGPYSRLVTAQKLRESDVKQVDPLEADDSTVRGIEDGPRGAFSKEAADEIPLGRIDTSRSLASEVLERRRQEENKSEQQYPMIYLFKRMGAINSDNWRRYLIGGIAACREFILSLPKQMLD